MVDSKEFRYTKDQVELKSATHELSSVITDLKKTSLELSKQVQLLREITQGSI